MDSVERTNSSTHDSTSRGFAPVNNSTISKNRSNFQGTPRTSAKSIHTSSISTKKSGLALATTRRNRNSRKSYLARRDGNNENTQTTKQKALKGGYLLLFLVAGIAIAKDLLDIFTMLLDVVGTGLTAIVILAPVGMPLAIFSEIVNKMSALVIDITMMVYFWYIGGKLALRLVIISIGAIIDSVPMLNVLPLTTLTFFAAFLAGRIISKVASTMVGGKATAFIVKKIAKTV